MRGSQFDQVVESQVGRNFVVLSLECSPLTSSCMLPHFGRRFVVVVVVVVAAGPDHIVVVLEEDLDRMEVDLGVPAEYKLASCEVTNEV